MVQKVRQEYEDRPEQKDLIESKMRMFYLIRELEKEQGDVDKDDFWKGREEMLGKEFMDKIRMKREDGEKITRRRKLLRKQHMVNQGDLAEIDSSEENNIMEEK